MTDLRRCNIISPATVSRLVAIAKHKAKKKAEKKQEERCRYSIKNDLCQDCTRYCMHSKHAEHLIHFDEEDLSYIPVARRWEF